MADNIDITPGSGKKVATDEVSFSGDTAHVELMRPVMVTGAEGSKTVVDLTGDNTNGLDVDVTRIIPGVAATNLGKAEDAAAADGDTGVMVLAVRNGTPGGTDGDYSTLNVDSTGQLKVVISTALSHAEDAPAVDGDAGVLMLAVRNGGPGGTDGDYSGLVVDAQGSLRIVSHRELKRIAVDTIDTGAAATRLTIVTTAYSAGDQVYSLMTLANAARYSGGGGVITGVVLMDANKVIGSYDIMFYRASVTLQNDNAAFNTSDADALNFVGMAQLVGGYAIGNQNVAVANGLAIPYDCSGTDLYAALVCRAGHAVFGAYADLRLTVFVERY